MKISTLLYVTGLVPAAVVAGPAPNPNPEPEPAPQAPQPVPPIKCILRGAVDMKIFPAQCAPTNGRLIKGTPVTFTCQILTDTLWLRVGPPGGNFVARNQDAVLPCISGVLPKC